MHLAENIYNAFHILTHNKVRSLLTMLGIIIGVSAVIMIISVGAGAQSLIFNQIKSQGTNLVAVFPGSGEDDGPPVSVMGVVITTLKYDDIKALQDPIQSPYVEAYTGYVRGSTSVTWQGNKEDTTYIGVSSGLLEVEGTKVVNGNFFTEEDEKTLQKVTVLGSDVKRNLFGDQDPIGEMIKIDKTTFRVIGVMTERGVSGFSNQDNQIYVPITTAQKLLLGINYVSYGRLKISDENKIDQAMSDIEEILRDRHDIAPNEPKDFDVRSQKESLDALLKITNAIKFFLAAIAGIALVVGGIGIMNIMLVSVQERIREIGLRKAVGAKSRQILFQFLIETIVLTFLAGVIGIIFGIFVSYGIFAIITFLGYDWEFSISLFSILLGVIVSSGIGLIFGLVPARRASRLNPIEALRYE